MKTLELKPNLGIGDMIFLYSELEDMKDRYDKFFIYPPYDMVKTFRGNTAINFPKQFLQILFSSDPKYELIESSNVHNMSPEEIENSYGCTTKFIDLADKFVSYKSPILSDFVCISTKIRYVTRKQFLDSFMQIVPILLKADLPIIILGERSIPVTPEPMSTMYSIYEDLMSSELHHLIIDLTKPTLLDCIDIESLKIDLNIMYNATCNIAWGVSGMSTLISCTAKNVAQYRADVIKFLDVYYGSITDNRKLVTKNVDMFVNHVQKCLGVTNGVSRFD